MTATTGQTMLWAATLGRIRPVRECIDAAAAAGLANTTVHGDRLLQHTPARADLRAIAAYAAGRGVNVALVDDVMAWFALDGPIARVAATTWRWRSRPARWTRRSRSPMRSMHAR